jgi:thymidylate synthase
MVAQVTGMIVGDFVHMGGDVHIYHDQFKAVDELLSRTPGKLPKLKLNQGVKSLKDFKMEDFELVGYDPQPAIAGPVSV